MNRCSIYSNQWFTILTVRNSFYCGHTVIFSSKTCDIYVFLLGINCVDGKTVTA